MTQCYAHVSDSIQQTPGPLGLHPHSSTGGLSNPKGLGHPPFKNRVNLQLACQVKKSGHCSPALLLVPAASLCIHSSSLPVWWILKADPILGFETTIFTSLTFRTCWVKGTQILEAEIHTPEHTTTDRLHGSGMSLGLDPQSLTHTTIPFSFIGK